MSLDLKTGEIEEFGRLPTGLASHSSYLIDDKYLIIYGGTNGQRFFDNVIRYDIDKKEWNLLTKYPNNSSFFKEGRLAHVSATSPVSEDGDQLWVLFGGVSDTSDCNEFLVMHKKHLLEDKNFSTITEIM